MKRLLTALTAVAVAATVHAHDMAPGEPQTQAILLQGGTLHTVANGTLENTDLLFEQGKITAIGDAIEVPSDARVIDVSGQHVYPGIIAMDTVLGLVEIEAVRATRDTDEVGPVHPEVSGHVAYNPDSEVIPTVRYNGITHAQVVPQGDLIMGRSSLMKTDAWTWEDASEQTNLGIHVSWPNTAISDAWWERRSPEEQRKAQAEARQRLQQVFVDAKAYYEAKQADKSIAKDIRWEAMTGLFDGSEKLYVHADDKRQIEQALAFAREYGFQLVIVGGRDAWRIIEPLRAAQVPVVYGAPYGLPSRDDESYDQAFRAPSQLIQAGVQVAIAIPGYWDIRNLPFAAGNTVAFGLDKEAALRAITLTPAEIMGVADRLGSLEVGKQASLIISQGDVMSQLGQDLSHMFINGAEVDLNNRHKQLYEKYKQK